VVEKLALPPAATVEVAAVPTRDAAPSDVEPFMKVTVPVGATPKLLAERVTLKVTEAPTTMLPDEGEGVLKTVTAGTTVKEYGELVLARKLGSPGNAAVRLLFPPGSMVVCSSAMPSLASAAVPSVVLPFLNVMVPVAAPFGFADEALLP
jgi:hypothetical protein